MPPEPKNHEKTATAPAADKAPSRNFKVVRGVVGPYPFGHVFSEADFRGRHPLTGSDAEKGQVDPATYHDDLISRLLALEVVEETDEPAADAPIGPENLSGGTKNAAIARAATEVVRARKAQRESVQEPATAGA